MINKLTISVNAPEITIHTYPGPFVTGYYLSKDGVIASPRELIKDPELRKRVMEEAEYICGMRK